MDGSGDYNGKWQHDHNRRWQWQWATLAQWAVERQSDCNGWWDGKSNDSDDDVKVGSGGGDNNNNDSRCGGRDGHHRMIKGRWHGNWTKQVMTAVTKMVMTTTLWSKRCRRQRGQKALMFVASHKDNAAAATTAPHSNKKILATGDNNLHVDGQQECHVWMPSDLTLSIWHNKAIRDGGEE
jgi:hypothetical protein